MSVKNEPKTGFAAQMGKGRPKGVLNKTTVGAKDAIARAAERLGGVERIVAWAQEDPKNESVFWASIFTKLVPTDIAHTVSNVAASALTDQELEQHIVTGSGARTQGKAKGPPVTH